MCESFLALGVSRGYVPILIALREPIALNSGFKWRTPIMALVMRVLGPSLSSDILSHFFSFVRRSRVGVVLSYGCPLLQVLQLPF